MIQTVHEIQDPFDVKTPLGEGVAMFMFTGSINSNPSFIIKFYHTGELRVVDMRDCIAYGNPSAGEKLEPNRMYYLTIEGSGLGQTIQSSLPKMSEMPEGRYVKI